MNRQRLIGPLLLIVDVVVGVAVFSIISYFRGINPEANILLGPLLVPLGAMIVAIYLIEGYRARTDTLSVDYLSQHTIALLGAMILTLLVTFVFIPSGYELQGSRAVLVLSFATLIPLTLVYRRTLRLILLKHTTVRSIVFIGDAASRATFSAEGARMHLPHPVRYAASDTEAHRSSGSTESLESVGEILALVDAGKLPLEAIILRESARELPADIGRRLVELYFAGIPTYTLELFHELYWRKIPLYRLNQTWLFQAGFSIAREPVFERVKRASDILLSLLALTLCAPLIALSAFAIWLEDRGPVFFRQTRIGKNHVPFRIVKLRTMRNGVSGANYTQPGDARITRVGRFLRASRLDEFPQLWNVLRGEMSLIGPRAEWDRLVTIYENEIPCYHFRHLVKPGITGWAQVNYPYGANIDDTTRKLEYDLYYIRHFSFLLDASIVLKTIHIMLFGKGR